MKNVRVAGIIPINGGYAFMHRKNVKKNKDYKEYYTFPGGHLEEGETLEECVIREIKEELGIKIKVVKKLYELENNDLGLKEYFYLCEYEEGEFGTGEGEEFTDDSRFKESGEYIPEIIKKQEISELILLPLEIKEKFQQDLERENF